MIPCDGVSASPSSLERRSRREGAWGGWWFLRCVPVLGVFLPGALLLGIWGAGERDLHAEPLTLAAASSLRPLLADLEPLCATKRGEVWRLVFASSGKLALQVEQGAPYDAYLSANRRWAERLLAKGRSADGQLHHIAQGVLVLQALPTLVLPPGTLDRARLRALLGAKRWRFMALANPGHAPYGVAARQVLERIGLWTELQDRLVQGENVLQAQRFLLSGNAELAFVARSQVKPEDNDWRPLEAELYDSIDYAALVLKAEGSPARTQDALSCIQSEAAAKLWRKHGLIPVVR